MTVRWPHGKAFAFTVFDDTDLAETGNFEEVYAFLRDQGMRTTKSVWPLRAPGAARFGGATCEEPAYRDHVLRLQEQGFEIGSHNTSFNPMPRADILRGFEAFRSLFGHDPVSLSNHADSAEAIYWGPARLSGARRGVYNLLTRGRHRGAFQGHVEGSPYFWGDLCRDRVTYVRNFITPRINTLAACPWMPYHDPARPYVRFWFASSEGPLVDSFNACLSEANQELLEAEGGACVMYTHFARGFQEGKRLDGRFRALLERLARRNGWFAPVSTVLDHLRSDGGPRLLTDAQRGRMERAWLWHKIRVGGTS